MIVLSDTHGHRDNVWRLEGAFKECDYILHLGDGALDMSEVLALYPKKTFVCRGNCDLARAPREGELEIEGVKIFFCHGDAYRVKWELFRLAEEAKSRGCQLALFGHTHRAEIAEVDGVTLVNPGSMKLPPFFGGSYAYITFKDGKAHPVIIGE